MADEWDRCFDGDCGGVVGGVGAAREERGGG